MFNVKRISSASQCHCVMFHRRQYMGGQGRSGGDQGVRLRTLLIGGQCETMLQSWIIELREVVVGLVQCPRHITKAAVLARILHCCQVLFSVFSVSRGLILLLLAGYNARTPLAPVFPVFCVLCSPGSSQQRAALATVPVTSFVFYSTLSSLITDCFNMITKRWRWNKICPFSAADFFLCIINLLVSMWSTEHLLCSFDWPCLWSWMVGFM